MNLTIVNGSPRGKSSNSSLITDWLTAEMGEDVVIERDIFLSNIKKHDEYLVKIKMADIIVFILPLYFDSMPGIVKLFIEKMEDLKGALIGKRMGFIIHSGFPEAIHSVYLKRYLNTLPEYFGAEPAGTLIKGGSEGFREMPPFLTNKPRKIFGQLGLSLVEKGQFDEELFLKLAGPLKLRPFSRFMMWLMIKTGIINMHWNKQMKKNSALDRSFAKPYEPASQ